MEFDIPLNLDGGFLRRQCPNCDGVFKWHHGPTDDRPDDAVDPPLYHCPYCGLTGGNDSWWTHEQAEYIQQVGLAQASGYLDDEIKRSLRGLNSKHIKVSHKPGRSPEPPTPPVEPDDMVIVASPCHDWEPTKVAEDWDQLVHCMVCGEAFAL